MPFAYRYPMRHGKNPGALNGNGRLLTTGTGRSADLRTRRLHPKSRRGSPPIDSVEKPKHVQDQLRHTPISMTFNTYDHPMLQAKQMATRKLE